MTLMLLEQTGSERDGEVANRAGAFMLSVWGSLITGDGAGDLLLRTRRDNNVAFQKLPSPLLQFSVLFMV